MREFGAVLVLIGSLFVLLAAIGVVRYPDPYMRMQAMGKAATLGLLLLLVGVWVCVPRAEVGARVAMTVVFLFVTAPVATHVLSRACYRSGIAPWHGTRVDEYGERFGTDEG